IEAAGEEKRKRLLQEVAGKLRQSVRNLDLVMRYGPAEFAILLPMTGNSGLKTVVRRLEHSISRITVKFLDGKQLSARLIFGGAAYSPQRKSPNEIFILAQQHIHLKRQRWQQKKAAEKA
ncbi:MAG TPA: diguanylate cyclase, partial [bacterium]|nr:diguanylate cyclase [bacterium]